MMSSIIDYTDRATCILFGDGAGAVMLEPSEDGYGLQDSILRADGVGKEFLYMKAGGSAFPATIESVTAKEHFASQEGRHVFKAAIKGMSSVIADLLEQNNLTQEDIAWLVPHQANKRILSSVAENIDFPIEKVVMNIHKYGNTTAGTIPLCLWEWEGQFKKDDLIVLTAFGGGFTWGACLLKWAYNA